jgi:hypothetical protein
LRFFWEANACGDGSEAVERQGGNGGGHEWDKHREGEKEREGRTERGRGEIGSTRCAACHRKVVELKLRAMAPTLTRWLALVAMAKYFTLWASSVNTVRMHTTVDTTTMSSTVYSKTLK